MRLPDYVVGGKLELSLRSYLELVMANNTDIAIQRLTLDVAQNAITRAFAAFDPLATASFSSTEPRAPSADQLTGASTLVQLSQPANFTYGQTLPTGLNYQVDFFAQKLSTNSGYYYYNPSLNSSLACEYFPTPASRTAAVISTGCPSWWPAATCAKPSTI